MRGNNLEDDGKLRGAVTRTLLSLTKGLVEAPEAVEKASLALAWHRLYRVAYGMKRDECD